MYDDLEKIDIIRDRMGISYREAKEALEKAEGDLVAALVMIEEHKNQGWSAKLVDKGDEIFNDVKTYVNKGNRTRVKVKNGAKTVAEFPATVGVIGVLAALASPPIAIITGVGAMAALANNIHLEIQGEDNQNKVVKFPGREDQ